MINVNIDEAQLEQIITDGADFYKVNKIPRVDLDAQISSFQSSIEAKNKEIDNLNTQIRNLQNVKLLVPVPPQPNSGAIAI